MRRRNQAPPKGRGGALGMPLAAWPEADRLAWESALVGDDSLDSRIDAAWMADNTRANLTTAYARWLVYLKEQHPESCAWTPGERFRREWMLEYLGMLRGGLKPSTVFVYACALRSMMAILAPETDRSWFERIIDNLERRAHRQPKAPKAIIEIDRLFAFGIEMMETAGADPEQPAVAVAEQFRDGLIFAFLAARPLRRANMVSLRIGQEVVATHDGFNVTIQAKSYKTGVPFHFSVPDRLAPYLRLYLAEHRPVLAAGEAGPAAIHLWLHQSGGRLTEDSLHKMIIRRSERGLGKRLTPHDFRHCAASSIVLFSADEWPIIKDILGHSSLRTAEVYYLHARGMAVAKTYQDTVLDRQKQAARSLIVPSTCQPACRGSSERHWCRLHHSVAFRCDGF